MKSCHPGTVARSVARAVPSQEGRYYIAADGRGAAFDAKRMFQYFGVFKP